MDTPPLLDGLADFARGYDVILSDVWGVVHNGHRHFAPACEALRRFRAGGGAVVLITNAPRDRGAVQPQLDALGVPRESYDALVTSGDVTLALMAAFGDAPVHHIGPRRDVTLFDAFIAQYGHQPPRVPIADADYVLVTGLARDEETPADYEERLRAMQARNLPMISANPDIVVHVGDTLVWCAGALARRYGEIGGDARQAGKPFRPIYDMALREAEQARGRRADLSRVLAIGDGLPTDIAGARATGIDALFIAHGIHRDDYVTQDGLDAASLARTLKAADARPRAVIPELVW